MRPEGDLLLEGDLLSEGDLLCEGDLAFAAVDSSVAAGGTSGTYVWSNSIYLTIYLSFAKL